MYPTRPIPGSILVVDDEPVLCEKLELFLRKRGYRVASCSTASEALERVTQESFDLILADASAPGPFGLQILDQIKARGGNENIVVISAYATIDQSVEAMRRGAADYLTKPFELHEVANVVERIIADRRDSTISKPEMAAKVNRGRNFGGNRTLHQPDMNQSPVQTRPDSPTEAKASLIGSSRAMKQLFTILERISPMDSSVLITGATGTGKELVARAIHQRSRRIKAPFIDINCSAIPDTLVEAELFGHQRGTFTGAHETRRGLFEEASGGTIFLDEVDALDLSAQAKLLRVLQERTLRRV
ncbi:MAG TPA: sigma 54-interacting transcriptional regulator, partial [Pyrinomonadaceae bacterium]|nr:sigma 54-interacting transcriptional regulator [Pyrinomonadaceae bacterium]